MGLFSRRKSANAEAWDGPEHGPDDFHEGAELPASDDHEDRDATAERLGAASVDGTTGPLDRSAVTDDSEYLNLGAIWIKGQQGLELRLEVNEREQQITGVTAVLGESAVQLQAFAAPRTEGVWIDIRNEIAKSITDAGGTAEVRTGEFGEELLTRMPQQGPEGRTVFMPARFVGFDGPRWFLRAVVSGRAAIDTDAAAGVHEIIRTAVIDRGDEARPPRELLPLRLPDAQPTGADQPTEAGPAAPPSVDDLKPFDRGPEITEVR
ncbi:DUF3710 domain-containing protein [Intrasporangium calvum]|uniref:DUF3710 domain-containing protein n=1 Tax=Intrasporangium calvum TaxID=53358 RepID=A0ABT5GLC8_9MICO|nr:DUF3710 domain-containing protein [Intrasporangium calvum]MDC5699053.1 DUF3710 domain-containing protein [Intrasporangium calvum]